MYTNPLVRMSKRVASKHVFKLKRREYRGRKKIKKNIKKIKSFQQCIGNCKFLAAQLILFK